MNASSTIRSVALGGLAAALLAGCAAPTREAGPVQVPVPIQPVAREGRPYQLIPDRSLLTILVYRGGTLARAGHNHVVASHDLSGVAYVPDDLTRASFELRIPVDKLTVDEPQLREAAGPDFPPGVPDSAREGTRRNMLGPALLDSEHYPEIVLRSERVDVAAPDGLLAHVQVTVRDQTHSVIVPVHYTLDPEELTAHGEFPLKHSELGLTPFSALLGAMQVQDEMKVRFEAHFAPSSVANASAP